MPDITFVGDIVEENGKTWRENREAIPHNIPIDTLVEVKYDSWYGNGACSKVRARLFVVEHARDCDGSPLYTLAAVPQKDEVLSLIDLRLQLPDFIRHQLDVALRHIVTGFSESSLTPVQVTPALLDGHGAFKWSEKD